MKVRSNEDAAGKLVSVTLHPLYERTNQATDRAQPGTSPLAGAKRASLQPNTLSIFQDNAESMAVAQGCATFISNLGYFAAEPLLSHSHP